MATIYDRISEERLGRGVVATEDDFRQFVSAFLNVMDDGKRAAFVEHMAREHRTLQQEFTRMVFAWLYKLAENEHYDARNEASVKAAREVVEALGEDGPALPFI